MCIREFIEYQCAHRSPPVLVTCPLTTEGHNHPVCDKRPDRRAIAETCCTACERLMHSRWVLIREVEHRWLHERGACGCEVVFHGLLNTPRVSGVDVDPKGTKNVPLAITDKSQPSDFDVEASEARKSKGKEQEKASSIADTAQHSSAPPLYNEVVTAEGESHVQLRLKSLYAGEWRADHRALHKAGKCNCRAIFAPFKPLIPDEELTAEEWQTVQWWRDQENVVESQNKEAEHHKSGAETGEEAVSRRMKEIQETFGSFDCKDNDRGMTQTQKPTVRSSHGSVAILPPSTTVAESSEQGHRRMGRRHAHNKSQPSFNRRGGKDRIRDRSQTHPLPHQPALPENQTQYTIQAPEQLGYHSQSAPVAPPSTPITQQGWVYDPFTTQMTLQHVQSQNVPLRSMGYYPIASGSYQQGSSSQYPPQLPQLPEVAHPAFATMATYTNTIPVGACPWVQQHAGSQRKSRSGGPFHYTPGLDYSSIDNPNKVDDISVPICGIPIGGKSHMPDWSECVLRKPRHPAPLDHSVAEFQAEAAPVNTNPGIVVEYHSSCDSKSDAGYGAATDDSAIEDDDLLGPGGSPTSQRRHSAVL